MASGRPLRDQLAFLGVNLPAWPEPQPTAVEEADGLAGGLACAEVLSRWRRQVLGEEESSRRLVAGLCEHGLEHPHPRGWDGWATVVLLSDLRGEASTGRLALNGAAIDPADLAPAQKIGAALAMIEDGQISAAALALSWLRPGDTPQRRWQQELLEIVLRRVCDPDRAQPGPSGSEPENPARQWLQDIARRSRLIQLLRALSREADDPGAPPPSAGLAALAGALRVDERASGDRPEAAAQMLWMAEANRRLQGGETEAGYRLLQDLLDPAVLPPPAGADGSGWRQLTINAAARAAAQAPRLTLIESKSLPRTGHHHLRRLLQSAHGEKFSYCERYQEPGCCQGTPCNAEPWWRHARRQGRDHVRLIKSHDYDLDDVPYPTPTGVVRLVQVRRPLPLLASWLELKQLNVNREMLKAHGIHPDRIYLYHEAALLESSWPLIDDCGTTMSREEALAWLEEKTAYIGAFLNKWLPLCSPLPSEGAPVCGTFLLRYEDLGSRAEVLRAIGGGDLGRPGPARAEATYSPREGSCLQRPSRRIRALLEPLEDALRQCETRILEDAAPWQHLLGYRAALRGS